MERTLLALHGDAGQLPTRWREPVSWLNRVVLPELGLPIRPRVNAVMGIPGGSVERDEGQQGEVPPQRQAGLAGLDLDRVAQRAMRTTRSAAPGRSPMENRRWR